MVFDKKYNIPLLCSENILLEGRHGMGSGSAGTNLDESLAHRVLQHYVAFKNHSILNPHSMCLGDDGIISYPGISVEAVVDNYSKFGQVMNKDKQYAATTHTIFLRRFYHTEYRENGVIRGIYSTFRALGRIMSQERMYDPKSWGPKAVILRTLSILENCNTHPLFPQLVKFVMKGDKYKLGKSLPGFLDSIGTEYQEAKAKLPGFGSYTQEYLHKDKGIET